MALTSRISSLLGAPDTDPEDFLASSLGVIFPDDVANSHGDASHALVYTSPHLPMPLTLTLCDPTTESDRRLYSHHLWNASLQLAELVESSTLSVPLGSPSPLGPPDPSSWTVAGKSILELGSGTALPSLLSALVGAKRIVVTDYPAAPVLANLKANLRRCLATKDPASSSVSWSPPLGAVVEGHAWGELDGDFALKEKGAFDRVFVCDCLWKPWENENLRRSIGHFLSNGPDARAWVLSNFHTGRQNVRDFFDHDRLASVELQVERIWERDCDGVEQEWVWDGNAQDTTKFENEKTALKRWLVIAILRRI